MTFRFIFSGLVQGLGFRPEAVRLAIKYNIKGDVRNSGGATVVTAVGEKENLDAFAKELTSCFQIEKLIKEETEEKNFDSFTIEKSDFEEKISGIAPDIATCSECERELFDKTNRRYMHPFISCTACGPRYTIIKKLPYDRENTAMDKFDLCPKCKNEYENIKDRRCFAQTIACSDCGPKLSMDINEGIKILKNDGVLAIKDTGGFHLACRIDCHDAVKKIRQIKKREKKAFAVMFSSLDEIKKYCFVNEKEKELLISNARPIVLLKRKVVLDESIVTDSEYIGAFLPCNPVQLIILKEVSPLVMTSANISGDIMITDNEEIKKLGVPVLSNDRDILVPLDDSVLQVILKDKVQFIRRARGYVPLGIKIEAKGEKPILALGGDLKSVFAFANEKYVYLSGNFGDLEDVSCFEGYKKEIDRFSKLFDIHKFDVVSDMHPMYFSTNLYKKVKKVQHHEAHAASVIAEHNLKGKVLAFVFDGTGYGRDGNIWGAEVFEFDGKKFKRAEHMKEVKIPAGDKIAKDCLLALSCYLKDNETLNKMLSLGINTVEYTGMGRLIDAVAAILDICILNTYEGEAASKLEHEASMAKKEYKLNPTWNPVEVINEVKNALEDGAKKREIAFGFLMMIVHLVVMMAEKHRIKQIVLSGGVFINRIITENIYKELEEKGFDVYINEKVPPLDGGLALGQAYLALNNVEGE